MWIFMYVNFSIEKAQSFQQVLKRIYDQKFKNQPSSGAFKKYFDISVSPPPFWNDEHDADKILIKLLLERLRGSS